MLRAHWWLLLALSLSGCHSAPKAAAVPSDGAAVPRMVAATPTVETRVCPRNLPRFEAYPVDSIYHGASQWPAVSLGADSEDLEHRGQLALADAKGSGPDFAGYLKVVESGCGSSCQVQQLVDLRVGKVVGDFTSNLGTAHRVGSRLIIANPMDSTQCFDTLSAVSRPVYYVWNGAGLDSIW